jgi:hypothetical protein
MKQLRLLLIVLILPGSAAKGAGVRPDRLEDFDTKIHKIAVNVEIDAIDGCHIDHANITEAEIQSLLQDQARRDVVAFARIHNR